MNYQSHRLFALALCLCCAALSGYPQAAPSVAGTPYLIPQTVFVGDPGQLVVPLGPSYSHLSSTVQEYPEGLSYSPDLVITRIELDARADSPRLIIDFIGYAPGELALPAISIGETAMPDIAIPIASILALESSRSLSRPASLLTAPGALMLVYATFGAAVLCIAGLVFFLFKGLPLLRRYGAHYRKRRAVWRMKQQLRRMRKALLKEDVPSIEILNELSRELRMLLGTLSGLNCMAMVPGEFLRFPPLTLADNQEAATKGDTQPHQEVRMPGASSPGVSSLGASSPKASSPGVSSSGVPSPGGSSPGGLLPLGVFLCELFRRSDTLRFSGSPISKGDVAVILEEVKGFALRLEKSAAPPAFGAGKAKAPGYQTATVGRAGGQG